MASIARISGGHINPAATVSMVVTRKIGLVKGVMYVVGQLVGAARGAYLLMAGSSPTPPKGPSALTL